MIARIHTYIHLSCPRYPLPFHLLRIQALLPHHIFSLFLSTSLLASVGVWTPLPLLFSWSGQMGHLARGLALVVWLLLLLLLSVSCCHGSRNMQAFDERPIVRRNSGFYFGFLPRGVPIPPSGPSKHHNSIGFESHRSP